MIILYGTINKKIDVTEQCFKFFYNNEMLIIPDDDVLRASKLGDVCPGELKSIFIDNKEYKHNNKVTLKIKYDDNNYTDKNINKAKKIINSNKSDKIIIAIIPVFGRELLLKYTIRRLYKKNNINLVICMAFSDSEKKVIEDENALFLKCENKPLGNKWNYGYLYSKQFNPDAILFVGSSDWISSDWLETAYNKIKLDNNIGYVGKRNFSMLDISNNKIRTCEWFGYICNRKNETIGIGRLISKNLLQKLNYKPFNDDMNSSMDYEMYLKCIKQKFKIEIIEDNSILLSISCDLWKNMHIFNYHYNAIQNIIIDNKNFKDNYGLYSNGKLFNKEEYEKILKIFPEILEFYNDYCSLK